MNAYAIKEMSTIERLQVMEALWESLLHDETEIQPPEWHLGILEERIQKIQHGEEKFISIEELKARRKS